MTFNAKFFVLSTTRAASKKTGEMYMSIDLFIAGTITNLYIRADKIDLFNDVKPEDYINLEFKLKNAYQSKDLQIDPISVNKVK
jgi:hypothetical protein